jgi:hypothetical protein
MGSPESESLSLPITPRERIPLVEVPVVPHIVVDKR